MWIYAQMICTDDIFCSSSNVAIVGGRFGNFLRDSPFVAFFTIGISPCTLWLFNIAMENGPFIDGLSIKNSDFPWLCLITRW